jgi:hypothetical protein
MFPSNWYAPTYFGRAYWPRELAVVIAADLVVVAGVQVRRTVAAHADVCRLVTTAADVRRLVTVRVER